MVSLAQEEFSNTNKSLFGPGFEQRLKTRSETAETIGKAVRAGKPFFRVAASRGFGHRLRGGQQGFSSRPFAHSEGAQHSTGVLGAEAAARFQRFPNPPVIQVATIVKSTRQEFLPTGMFLEICQHSIPQDLPQTAHLKFFLPSWERITQDPWVLEVIQGYKIELVTPPVQQSLPPVAKLSLTQEAVLEQEVNKLLAKQAIHPIHPSNQEVGFISSMFVVPKKDEAVAL